MKRGIFAALLGLTVGVLAYKMTTKVIDSGSAPSANQELDDDEELAEFMTQHAEAF